MITVKWFHLFSPSRTLGVGTLANQTSNATSGAPGGVVRIVQDRLGQLTVPVASPVT